MTSCTILDDDDPDWLFEFKYDGFRALCYLDLGRGRFVSRNGNLLSRFDDLACLVAAELEVDEAILDGEVIAPDETGRTVFFDLLRSRRKPAYVVFDLLWLKTGADLRSLPLSDWRRRLQGILPAGSLIISEALSVRGRGRELFELMGSRHRTGRIARFAARTGNIGRDTLAGSVAVMGGNQPFACHGSNEPNRPFADNSHRISTPRNSLKSSCPATVRSS